MQNNTHINSESYNNTSFLTNVIHFAVTSFCSKIGFNAPFFSRFLPYSEKQFPKYLNPNDETKQLKIADLELILKNLDSEHKKIILDSLCSQFGFVCVENVKSLQSKDSIENLLLRLSSTNGELAASFLESLKDGEITDDEKQSLALIAYDFRKLLITFQTRINEI